MSATILRLPPELILHVLSEMKKDQPDWFWREDLGRVALVNKALSQLALDLLWREMTTLEPLIMLLQIQENNEPDLANQELMSVLSAAYPECWERFDYYASRVRSLYLNFERPDVDSDSDSGSDSGSSMGSNFDPFDRSSTWGTSCYRPGRDLLPNLTELHIVGHLNAYLHWSLLLSAPSLRSVSYQMIEQSVIIHSRDRREDYITGGLLALVSNAGTMEVLQIAGSPIGPDLNVIIAINKFAVLRHLDIVFEQSSNLHLLFPTFMHLCQLQLAVTRGFSAVNSLPRFPYLRELSLRAFKGEFVDYDCHSELKHAVRAFASSRIAKFTLEMPIRGEKALLSVVFSTWRTSLTDIKLRRRQWSYLSFATVKPLLDLHALQSVFISVPTIVLNDSRFCRFAEAWPHVIKLELRSYVKGPSLDGLLKAIIPNCPDLRVLLLDGVTVDRVPALTELPSVDHPLSELSFCCLGKTHSHQLGPLLSALFPQLTTFEIEVVPSKKEVTLDEWHKLASLLA